MNITSKLLKIAAPLAALAALGACTTPGFRTEVSRFNAMPEAAQGQTFFITSDDPKLAGGIEFGQYADMLAQEMAAEGFVPAASADSADLIVNMAYTMDKGEVKLYRDYDPFYFGMGFGGWRHDHAADRGRRDVQHHRAQLDGRPHRAALQGHLAAAAGRVLSRLGGGLDAGRRESGDPQVHRGSAVNRLRRPTPAAELHQRVTLAATC